MKEPSETTIVKACLQYLQLRGIVAWRNNSGAVTATHKGKHRFVRFNGAPGSSDIIGLVDGGTFLAVEVKRPGSKPTPHQQAFLDDVRRHGGIALVVDGVDSLIRQLDEAGV